MKVLNEAKEVAERFRISFLNEKRGCIFKENVQEMDLGGRKIGPFKAGDQTELPNWMIEKLLVQDLIDLVPENAYESMRRLLNLYRAEEKQPHKLQSFHAFLYTAIGQKMLRLRKDKTALDPRKYEEIERMERMIPFLVETRLSKIIRVAKSGAYQEKRRYMAHEERWLCRELVEILTDWRGMIVR